MNRYLYRSIVLHAAAFLILVLDMPLFFKPEITMGQAPIIVDLKDVKLAEITNLPPKAVFGEEDKPATAPKKEKTKSQPNWTREEKPKPEPEPEPEKIKEQEPKKDFVDTTPEPEEKPDTKPVEKPKPKPKPVPKPAKKPAPKPQPKPKPKPQPKPQPTPQVNKPEVKKPAPKKQEVQKTVANPLKSLMDSVSSLEQQIGQETSPAVIKTGTEVVNMGIEGGTSGSYFSELTITETDAIAGHLRECWNFDPGGRGVEDMIIELNAVLNQNGTIRHVEIVDKSRYNSDSHFRSAAESAKRAIYLCQNKNGVNIYKVFAEKYADKYEEWSSITLRFNPMDASIK